MDRKKVVSGVVAAIIVAAGITYGIVSGGAGHHDTNLDASSSTAPPRDWSSGYTRTGVIAYPQDTSGSEAKLFAANVIPYMGDATDVGWPVELTQVNRIPINVSGACSGAPWDCSTATMDSTTVAPDSTATASTITMGGGSLDATAFGYTNSTALDLRLYAKCSTGTLDASNIGGAGHWTVNCATVAGAWTLLHSAHAAVTEVQAWTSNGSGGVRLRLSGADAAIWHTTATEKVSWQNSTIPTTDATGTTVGTAAWTVNNDLGAYWATSGVTKTETLSEYSGSCWVYSGTTIKLTGTAGCEATWYALSLAWSN